MSIKYFGPDAIVFQGIDISPGEHSYRFQVCNGRLEYGSMSRLRFALEDSGVDFVISETIEKIYSPNLIQVEVIYHVFE